jgi:chaperone BCS1
MTVDPLLAGAALGLAGGALAFTRNIPAQLATGVKRQFMVSVDVQENTSLFYMLSRWLDAQPYARSSRLIMASIGWKRSRPGEEDAEPQIIFTPGVGDHVLRFEGRLIWITRARRDGQYGPIDSFQLRAFGRDQDLFRRLFLDVEAVCRAVDRSQLRVFMPSGDGWREVARKIPRPIESVILDGTLRDEMLADVRSFLADHDRYRNLGAPYRRGYLFYGPSGSGKSSLIEALAGVNARDLYALNLARAGLDDVILNELLITVPPRGAVLIEDCDAVFHHREREADTTRAALSSMVTFSGLLNALDGVGTKDGQLVFMTTNYIERLDEALIRPGRVDVQAFIGNATRAQAAAMFSRFHPGSARAVEFADTVPIDEVKMAAIQGHLLSHPDADQAICCVPWAKLKAA